MSFQLNAFSQKKIETSLGLFDWSRAGGRPVSCRSGINCVHEGIYTSCKYKLFEPFLIDIPSTDSCNENSSHETIPARHSGVLQRGMLGLRVSNPHHRSTKDHFTATSRLRDMELKGLSRKHICGSFNCHSDWLPSNWLCCSLQEWTSSWSRHRRRVEESEFD